MDDYIARYLTEVQCVAGNIDPSQIEQIIEYLVQVRDEHGRVFFLGVGGGAGNATHAVNDFRKIADIECYTPTDNVSELTARVNDEGWEGVFVSWLRTCKLSDKDAVFVFSVGAVSYTHLTLPTNREV